MLFGIRWGSLRTKIIAWSFVPAAIILGAVALVGFYAYNRVTGDLVVEKNQEVARLSAGQLAAELEEYTGVLTNLVRSPDIYAGTPAAQRGALKAASNRLVVFDAGLVLLDNHGTVTATEPQRSEIIGQDWSAREYFREMARMPGPVFSDVVRDGPDQAAVVVVAVPMVGTLGEFRGMAAGMFRLGATTVSAFYGSVVKLRLAGGETAYLVDRNGQVIYHADTERIGEDFSGQYAVQQVSSGKTGALRTRDVQGHNIVASYSPVPGTPWGLVTEVSWDKLMAPSQGYRRFLLLLLALGVIFPAVVVAFASRRLTQPITELIGAAREVASGQFGRTIQARTGDEIEALVMQFNSMSAQLSESYNELRAREERLALVLEGTSDGFWDWDLRTDQVYFSARWKSMLDYADDEIPGEFAAWRQLLHPDDLEATLIQLQDYLEGRAAAYTPEFRMRHKDGSYRWILARAIALRDADGKPYRMAGSHTDITDRKRSDAALQERLAFEKLISDISTEFVNLGPDEIDTGIQHALEAIGRFAAADRCSVFLLSGDGASMTNIHEWHAPGIAAQGAQGEARPIEVAPWTLDRIKRSETVNIARVSEMPAEASADRAEFQALGLRSLVCVPMSYRGEAFGFVCLGSVNTERAWAEQHVALVKIAGEIFANALEHRRAQAIQAGQRQFLELLATGGSFSETLHALVRLIEEQWPGMLGLVLLLDEDGRRLHVGAAESLPEEYIRSIEGLEIGPMVGSCGTACCRRERVIVEDIATDPRWDGLRDLGLTYGLRACWSQPVFSADERVVGTFAMYYRQPRVPTQAELRAIETAAHLVSVAVEHRRAQDALQTAYQTLERRVEERTHELATLNAIAATVSRSLDLQEIMSVALDKMLEITAVEFGGAYRLEQDGQDSTNGPFLTLFAHHGLSEETTSLISMLPLRGSVVETATVQRGPLVWEVASTPNPPAVKRALAQEGIRQAVSVPLMAKGRLVGALQVGSRTVRSFAPEQLSLLWAIGQQVGVAVENARLYEQAQTSAALAERSRLARELHDSVTQSLYSVSLYAEAAARLLFSGDTAQAADHLRSLRDTAQEALREMRLLIFELRPLALENVGLIAALRARLDAVEARGGMQAELRVEGAQYEDRLSRSTQQELYHIVQEALNNVLKHAHAQHVMVNARFDETTATLEVRDDGAGFEPAIVRSQGGLGLQGMKERTQRIGGVLRIESAPGRGARITIQVPVPNSQQMGATE